MYIFSIYFDMKICCVFSLESPHPGDSNEYTRYTIFNMEKKHTKLSLKKKFETAAVNEISVFEPLKVAVRVGRKTPRN